MNAAQSMSERLRPLLGIKGWDYCVVWKLSDDQRRIEMMGCCCGGAEESSRKAEDLHFRVPCRDLMVQHARSKACDALDELPCSLPLDSGYHTEALLSSKPAWLTHPDASPPSISDEAVKTRVLIPVACGLVELFAAKHVPEDYQTIEFIMAQCNSPSFDWVQQPCENLSLPWDLSSDPIRLCNSPLDFMLPENHGFPDIVSLHGQSLPESSLSKENGYEKESVKQETGRGDSFSDCSDQIEDDDDQKTGGRSGRRNQSKNLVAERKRRKKLNDRLYALRALVPKITKMDRAAILGDAIDFVKELQQQVKDLQDELEEAPEEEGGRQQSGSQLVGHHGGDKSPDGSGIVVDQGITRCSTDASKQNRDSLSPDEKGQQMEVQVEVSQVNGNEFFLKVFCEHKPGGFMRLMEAMNSLGLDVTNVNVTTFRSLVLNVFKVEKRDSEVVEADQVRDSLLELTRNPIGSGGYSEPEVTTENAMVEYHPPLHHHHCHNHRDHSEQQFDALAHHLHPLVTASELRKRKIM